MSQALFHSDKWKKRVHALRYFWDSIKSKAYWRYVLVSPSGFGTYLAVFGAFNVVIGSLDFFNIYTRDKYAAWAFPLLLVASLVFSILFLRRPVNSIEIKIPQRDYSIEVKIDDLFEFTGAVMISTNTEFECDVADKKIAVDSLQGQFTARYFAGSQTDLIDKVNQQLENIDGSAPYPMGTTVPVTTHGKTFYFTVMAELNDQGNASTTRSHVTEALKGLWAHVRNFGELQELAVPVIGTARGRLKASRKKMISIIAESFFDASADHKVSDKLVIVVRPEDASKFKLNLYEVKDHLDHVLSV